MTASTLSTYSVAVLIGRFQPFHQGHLGLLRRALELAPRVVVVLGSAFQARSPKNPLDVAEREAMVRRSLSEAEQSRVRFVAVRDHVDDKRWVAEVRRAVVDADAAAAAPAAVALVGCERDATRAYLHDFPGWVLHAEPERPLRRASAMRQALFADPVAALADLAGDAGAGAATGATGASGLTGATGATAATAELPPGSADYLRQWVGSPEFQPLAEEAAVLAQYEASWQAAPYPPVLVTVDCVVRCRDRVLLIRRGQAPGKGLLAVPGGFLEQRETTRQAALRELDEETHLGLPAATLRACISRFDVFDRPDRSQRGRTITHGFFFDLGERELPSLQADDDAAAATWEPIDGLGALEARFLDDHFQILDHYLKLLPP